MSYYRSVIQLEILSNDPIPPGYDLTDIVEEMTNGEYSGRWNIAEQKEVSKEEMHELLQAQGSDPTFLDDGYEDEEDE